MPEWHNSNIFTTFKQHSVKIAKSCYSTPRANWVLQLPENMPVMAIGCSLLILSHKVSVINCVAHHALKQPFQIMQLFAVARYMVLWVPHLWQLHKAALAQGSRSQGNCASLGISQVNWVDLLVCLSWCMYTEEASYLVLCFGTRLSYWRKERDLILLL